MRCGARARPDGGLSFRRKRKFMRPQSALVLAIASAAVTAGGTATASVIDSRSPSRARHMSIDVVMTTADVVSNKPSVFKLQHSDITDATGYSDVTGFAGGTDWTIPSAD